MEKYCNIEIYIQELFTHKKFNFILDIANKHIKICKNTVTVAEIQQKRG